MAGINGFPWKSKLASCKGLSDYERIVPTTLEILRTLNCRVNASTGHHLHIGFHEVNADARVIRPLQLDPPIRTSSVFTGDGSPQKQFVLSATAGRHANCSTVAESCPVLGGFGRFERYQALNWSHLFDDDGSPELNSVSPGNVRLQ